MDLRKKFNLDDFGSESRELVPGEHLPAEPIGSDHDHASGGWKSDMAPDGYDR